MASGYNHRQSNSNSSATFSTSTREQSPVPSSLNHHASAASSSAGGEDDEYDDHELQLIMDIVVRAQELLPTLPATSRHPTSALFLAYDEVVDEIGVDLSDGRKLDKLLFKIGGSRHGDSIIEKFQAVMARMNITVRLDVNGVEAAESPPGSTEDDASSRGDYHEYNHNHHHSNQSDEDQSRSYASQEGTQELEHYPAKTTAMPQQLGNNHASNDDGAGVAALRLRNEVAFEKIIVGFERYRSEILTRTALRHWQDLSFKIADTTQLFLDAREADLQDGLQAVVIAWNEIAIEIDELPLDDVPTNVYSKRIEYIALRTHHIYSTKNAFARWRQCTRERCRREELPVDELDVNEENPRLSKLAKRAHENLMKSRVFTRWSNRVSEEDNKAKVAAMAHEMGLKSRALGVRPKLEMLASALQQRLQNQVARPVESLAEHSPQPPVPPPLEPSLTVPFEPSSNPTIDPSKPIQPDLEPVKPLLQPIVSPSPLSEPMDEPPEADERTKLARRHILRMRFFRAWEDYTQEYKTKANDFPLKKALDPWRERSSDLLGKVSDVSQKHDEWLVKNALHRWADAVSHSAGLEAKANEIEPRICVVGALKPWIAAARHDRKTLQMKHDALKDWYYAQDREVDLRTIAESFYITWRCRSVLTTWRGAARDVAARKIEFAGYAQRADYYRTVHGTLHLWKARARENAVYVSMKAEAVETWRDSRQISLSRHQERARYAERANFYYSITPLLPAWRDTAEKAVDRRRELQEYIQRMDYDNRTRDTVVVWRTLAKERRKVRLKEAHLEVRRRVKKGMGARTVALWREKLEVSYTRNEQMSLALEEITTNREWDGTAEAFDIWRMRAQEKAELNMVSNAMVMQQVLDRWKEHIARHGELQAEAEDYCDERAASRALKDWKLSSLQMESRRQTVGKHLNKDRKLLKQGFEDWYGSTADKLVPTQLADGSYRSVANMVQDAKSQADQAQTKNLFSAWRVAAARGGLSQAEVADEDEEGEVEEADYAPTPGRPQLLLGSLGRRQTTTPLAPIPQRQRWQGGPADSLLGRSAPGGTASGSSRSRRNLRVSWAE